MNEKEVQYPLMVRIKNELLPLALLVIVLIAAITFFPSNILRIVLGLPFVLFFPGYTLMAAIFPRRKGMGGIERVALSFGLSIAVVPLIGLILNYTPWGIRLESILWSIGSFIFIMAVVAWLRRKGLSEEERFCIEFHLTSLGWGKGIQNKVLSIILMLTVLGAFGIIGYAIATPKVGQKFTEFYVLSQEGEAASYPRELKVGEEGKVMVAIVNHEYETVSYRIEVRIDGVKNNEVNGITLEHEEKWESEVSFTPEMVGDNQKVEFFLFRDSEAQPFSGALHLWIDVTQ